MILATVIGRVEIAARAPGFEGVRWAQVRTGQEVLVAADPLGVSAGQTVLLARGESARSWQQGLNADALIAAVIKTG